MKDTDRRLVLKAQANADEWDLYGPTGNSVTMDAATDRRELLRIVRDLDALLRERDTQAEDLADDAAVERATAGKWGGG